MPYPAIPYLGFPGHIEQEDPDLTTDIAVAITDPVIRVAVSTSGISVDVSQDTISVAVSDDTIAVTITDPAVLTEVG